MTCPSLTELLKSAPSFEIVPDTSEPTCTVTTALIAPVAVTVASTEPRSMRAVRKVTGGTVFARRHAQAPPASTAAPTNTIVTLERRFDEAILFRGKPIRRPLASQDLRHGRADFVRLSRRSTGAKGHASGRNATAL